MKTVVIISIHNSHKNCYSSKDFDGYKDFDAQKEAKEFIKLNNFEIKDVYIDSELDIRLIHLMSYEYNRNRTKAEQLFIKGYSEDSKKYWEKQEAIRNTYRKEEGFIYCKKIDEMTAEDYKGSLEKALTKTTINYISSGVVAGYLGHSARKHEYDKYIEEVINNVTISVDDLKVNKWDILSTWLTSTDARHWMDSVEDMDIEKFKIKFNNYIPELMTTGYIYSLKEHRGTYKSTMELEGIYANRIKVSIA